VHLQAEFNFKASRAAQRLKIQRLQNLFAGLMALFIYYLISDAIATGLLELTLLLVLLRARQALTLFTAVESLVVKNKSAVASINGRHHPLSAYGLDYFSSYLALVSLTTVAGETYRCFVFPDLFGAVKYRQLLALLKAAPTAAAKRLA
jgi:hypothetical protein